ncbi:MAG: phosphoethanolamine transferase, partial [Burkholderiaceae bacterium]|nr:phosphoethanolamine transferase [Burkholderiaceae bacterium]
ETARALQLDAACFAQRARQPASHDNLFHSLLGMFDVQTPRYDASRDLLARCRRAAAAPS